VGEQVVLEGQSLPARGQSVEASRRGMTLTQILQIAWRFLLAKRRRIAGASPASSSAWPSSLSPRLRRAVFEGFFITSVWGPTGFAAFRPRPGQRPTHAAQGDVRAGFQVPLREGRTYAPACSIPQVMQAVRRFEEVAA
jgi:hypothetical protein